jgi:isopenicillin N synthase-like dioxygenase
MNGVWKKDCPNFVHDFMGYDAQMKKVTKKIVELATKLDFDLDETMLKSCWTHIQKSYPIRTL